MGVAVLPALAIASAVAGVAGTVVSMVGAHQAADAQAEAAQQEAQAQAQAARYNAQVAANNATIAKQNADYATAAGNAEAEKQMMANRQKEGEIRAAGAASGLDVNSGSMYQLQKGQDLIGQLDVATIRNNAALKAYGYNSQATNYKAQQQLDLQQAGFDVAAGNAKASAAEAAGNTQGISSLLSGATSVTGKLSDYYQKGVFS